MATRLNGLSLKSRRGLLLVCCRQWWPRRWHLMPTYHIPLNREASFYSMTTNSTLVWFWRVPDFSNEVFAEAVDDTDDIVAQEALCETTHGSKLSSIDCSVILPALRRLTKTVLALRLGTGDLGLCLVCDLEASKLLLQKRINRLSGRKGSFPFLRTALVTQLTSLPTCEKVSQFQVGLRPFCWLTQRKLLD